MTTDVVKVDGIIVSSTWLYRDLLLVADMATLVGQAADSAKVNFSVDNLFRRIVSGCVLGCACGPTA